MVSQTLLERLTDIIEKTLRIEFPDQQPDNQRAIADLIASEILMEVHDRATTDQFAPEGTDYAELEDQYNNLRFAFEHYVTNQRRVFEFLAEHGAYSLQHLVEKHQRELEEAREDDGL